MYDLCFDTALKPLSTISLAEIPSLLAYLPTPSAPEFPVQALGLHLLLDQVPRQILRGIDSRWTFEYFGALTLRLAKELAALPVAVQPQRVQRWLDLGYNYEGAWLRVFLMYTAFIHSEGREPQRFGQRLIEEECRKGAEAHYGLTDPTRPLDEADDKDLTLFSKLVSEVEDRAEGRSKEEGVWLLCRIVRVHEPIISAFGRYPYRNGAIGREEAEGEGEFLKKTAMFGVCDSVTANKVIEDVKAGKWTPLQGGRPE